MRAKGFTKHPLGDPFGLAVLGVNLTHLAPGAWSTLHHQHSRQGRRRTLGPSREDVA
jgi:uncharacterized cupin superfamily protein